MNANKSIARIIGALFITATAASSLSIIFTEPILDASDYLTTISENETKFISAMLLMLVDAIAVTGIAIVFYPILKKQNTVLALGYVGARVVESVLFIVHVIFLLTLFTLSQEFVKAGLPDTSYLQTEGIVLLAASDWAFSIGLGIIFTLSAFILNYSLYVSKLVPRWLSVWGFIGALLSFFVVLMRFFNIHITETLDVPIAIQEMVFALWLIVKGFNQDALNSSRPEIVRSS